MTSVSSMFLYLCAALVGVAAAIKTLPVFWGFLKSAAKVPAVLEAIAHEFSPNNGSSLRDSVNRLEAALAAEVSRQTAHQAAVASALMDQQELMAERMAAQQDEVFHRLSDVADWMNMHSTQDHQFAESVHEGLSTIQELVTRIDR